MWCSDGSSLKLSVVRQEEGGGGGGGRALWAGTLGGRGAVGRNVAGRHNGGGGGRAQRLVHWPQAACLGSHLANTACCSHQPTPPGPLFPFLLCASPAATIYPRPYFTLLPHLATACRSCQPKNPTSPPPFHCLLILSVHSHGPSLPPSPSIACHIGLSLPPAPACLSLACKV